MGKKLESHRESKLTLIIDSLGGMCMKWVSPGRRGVHDRIIMMPFGWVYFVEVKADGEYLDPLQEEFHKRCDELQAPHFLIDSDESLNNFIWKIKTDQFIR